MGRKKIKIARLPSESGRKGTYNTRKKGILKKVYSISTLCDIQAVLIMFSPSGKLDTFSSKPGIFDILQKLIYADQITSEIDSESLQASKDVMDNIDYFSALYDTTNSSGEILHDEIEVMLQELQKKMMHPESEAFDSIQEFEKLIHGLENVRRIIANRRNAGRPILMEQPQARIEDGMWGPLQGEVHMQQQVVGMFGLSTAPSVPWEMPSVLGGEHIQQHNVPIFGTKYPSLSLGGAPWQLPMPQLQGGEPMPQQGVPEIGGQQNIHTPTSLFEQFHSEPFMEQYRASVACGPMPQLQGGQPMQQQGVPAIGAQQNIHTEQYIASVDSAQWLGNLNNNWDGSS